MNMIIPAIKEIIAPVSTAAAERSFIFFIVSCFSGETKSAIFSMAELINSKANTPPIQRKITIHSYMDIRNTIPATNTNSAMNRCIRALCSSFNKIFKPLKAYLKLTNRFRIENFSSTIILQDFLCKNITNQKKNNIKQQKQ